ncbi:hypothetical protein NCER_102505 [Vairimorpha ceranae BRL01]|uniref:Uncharacterized protein n=1 Tax=Vairimorpha ceranae (strain BRL01) TaxID=578460 RepID=C4VC44_VAIC1|nr:hypothetical protein NCER_102505 [Vairimorpha ceranae BRL01]
MKNMTNSFFSKFVQQNIHCSMHYLRSILKPHYHAIPFVHPPIKFKYCFVFVFFFYLNVIKFSLKSITVNNFDSFAARITTLNLGKLYGSFSTKSFKHIRLLIVLTSIRFTYCPNRVSTFRYRFPNYSSIFKIYKVSICFFF